MSLTPFDEGLLQGFFDPLTFCEQGNVSVLNTWCGAHPISTHLLAGPQGSGKTTLIRSYFTEKRCRELAQRKALVKQCYFTSGQLRNDVEVFQTLIRAVKRCLDHLEPDSPERIALEKKFAQEEAKSAYANARTDPSDAQELLRNLILSLNKAGYCVCLLIDDFQQLTLSEYCAANTFNSMAALVQDKDLVFSYIIVTDLPIRVASKSYEISNFNRILPEASFVQGITSRPVVRKMKKLIQQSVDLWQDQEERKAEDRFHFSNDELEMLWKMSGGLPGVLRRCLKSLYGYRELHPNDCLTWDDLQQIALDGCEELMRHWIKHLNDGWDDTMRLILSGFDNDQIRLSLPRKKDWRGDLRTGGLIKSNPSNKNTWVTVCPLFGEFLRRELNRPDPEKEASYMYSASPHMYSASQYLEMLGLRSGTSRQIRPSSSVLNSYIALHDQLRGMMLQSVPQLEIGEVFPVQEDPVLEQKIDEQMSDLGSAILPDIDPNSLKDAPMPELDRRFKELRRSMGLDKDLDDRLMERLSPMCQFYAKASLLVENHMNTLEPLLQDYSVQLVMYAKCMEQCLRDSIYPLFKNHSQLQDYNFYSHRDTPGDKNTFGTFPSETYAMLGNFYHALNGTADRLGRMCERYQLLLPGVEHMPVNFSWTSWWKAFASKLRKAKDLRNELHSGGQFFTKESLDELRRDIFGSQGILYSCQVGRTLYEMTRNQI